MKTTLAKPQIRKKREPRKAIPSRKGKAKICIESLL